MICIDLAPTRLLSLAGDVVQQRVFESDDHSLLSLYLEPVAAFPLAVCCGSLTFDFYDFAFRSFYVLPWCHAMTTYPDEQLPP